MMASVSCFANGVDHLWPSSSGNVELHLAPETLHRRGFIFVAFLLNCLTLRLRLIRMVYDRQMK